MYEWWYLFLHDAEMFGVTMFFFFLFSIPIAMFVYHMFFED